MTNNLFMKFAVGWKSNILFLDSCIRCSIILLFVFPIYAYAFFQNQFYTFFSYPFSELNKFCWHTWLLRRKYSFSAYVLVINILCPLFYHTFIAQIP